MSAAMTAIPAPTVSGRVRRIPKKPDEYTSRDFFSDDDLLRVRRVMLALDWKWVIDNEKGFSPENYETPTVERMRRSLDRLLSDCQSTSSGGFCIERKAGLTCITFEAVTSRWKRPHKGVLR